MRFISNCEVIKRKGPSMFVPISCGCNYLWRILIATMQNLATLYVINIFFPKRRKSKRKSLFWPLNCVGKRKIKIIGAIEKHICNCLYDPLCYKDKLFHTADFSKTLVLPLRIKNKETSRLVLKKALWKGG